MSLLRPCGLVGVFAQQPAQPKAIVVAAAQAIFRTGDIKGASLCSLVYPGRIHPPRINEVALSFVGAGYEAVRSR